RFFPSSFLSSEALHFYKCCTMNLSAIAMSAVRLHDRKRVQFNYIKNRTCVCVCVCVCGQTVPQSALLVSLLLLSLPVALKPAQVSSPFFPTHTHTHLHPHTPHS